MTTKTKCSAKKAEVLKVDAMGRVTTPGAVREAALDEFERSGLPATKFAARIGVKYQTFATWVQRRRRGRGGAVVSAAEAAKVGAEGGVLPHFLRDEGRCWVEAVAEVQLPALLDRAGHSGVKAGVLLVELPGGARVEVGDVQQARLAAVLLRDLAVAGGAAC
jgi:transposase-like protein